MKIKDVLVSFHPSGHILGSAQIRIEHRGEVWVVSGDYKTAADSTCQPIEIVPCHTFITESTFGLPIYRWPDASKVFQDINSWWKHNHQNGITSIIFCYALGKAQRILSGIEKQIGHILTHGAVEQLNEVYRQCGVDLPQTTYAGSLERNKKLKGSIVIAPTSAQGSSWLKRFEPYSTAFASGWMRIRGTRRRKAIDRGFVLSDHADWDGLLDVIKSTGAERIITTHGNPHAITRWLNESGFQARSFQTEYGEEETSATIETNENEESLNETPAELSKEES